MEIAVLVQSQWRRRIMARMVEVDTREWRDIRMRETAAAVHGNTTRDNNNPLISVSPQEGLTKKRYLPVASGCGQSWAASAIGDIVFSGRTVIGGGVAEAGDSVLPWQSKTCAIAGKMGMVDVRDDNKVDVVAVGGGATDIQD